MPGLGRYVALPVYIPMLCPMLAALGVPKLKAFKVLAQLPNGL